MVTVFGNQASGKSTIMNSLVFGPNSLQVGIEAVKDNFATPDRKKSSPSSDKKVKVLKQKEGIDVFKIGRSGDSEATTFLPEFVMNHTCNLVFADLASIKLENNSMNELVNFFSTKFLI